MSVFFSYRSDDCGEFVDCFLKKEKALRGLNIFYDRKNIPSGVKHDHYIFSEIEKCDLFCVFIGNNWEANGKINDHDDYPRKEIEHALKNNKKIVPILIDRSKPPSKEEISGDASKISNINPFRIESKDNSAERVALMINNFTKGMVKKDRRHLGYQYLLFIALVYCFYSSPNMNGAKIDFHYLLPGIGALISFHFGRKGFFISSVAALSAIFGYVSDWGGSSSNIGIFIITVMFSYCFLEPRILLKNQKESVLLYIALALVGFGVSHTIGGGYPGYYIHMDWMAILPIICLLSAHNNSAWKIIIAITIFSQALWYYLNFILSYNPVSEGFNIHYNNLGFIGIFSIFAFIKTFSDRNRILEIQEVSNNTYILHLSPLFITVVGFMVSSMDLRIQPDLFIMRDWHYCFLGLFYGYFLAFEGKSVFKAYLFILLISVLNMLYFTLYRSGEINPIGSILWLCYCFAGLKMRQMLYFTKLKEL